MIGRLTLIVVILVAITIIRPAIVVLVVGVSIVASVV